MLTPDTLVMDKSQIVANARALAADISARADTADQNRTIPQESVSDLFDAGIARIFVPREFGGNELGLDTWYEAVREISKADASHGWCASIMAHHGHMLNQYPYQAQQDVWGDGPDVSIAASVAPNLDVKKTDGGYRVSGQKSSFASGVNHSQWAMLGGFVHEGEKPLWCYFLVPASDFTIKDTWHTGAMRGTGSNTVITDNVFVPEHRVLTLPDLRDGTGSTRQGNYIFNAPFYFYATMTFVAPMAGAAMGAYGHVLDLTRKRVGARGQKIAEQASVQQKLARVAADLDAADMLLSRAADIPAMAGMSQRDIMARNARDCTRAAEIAVECVDTLIALCGTAAFAENHPVQRAWRDIHLAAAHMSLNPDINYANYSRLEFGLGPDLSNPYFF